MALASFYIVNSHTVTATNGDIKVVIEAMYGDAIAFKTSTPEAMLHRADLIAIFAMNLAKTSPKNISLWNYELSVGQ